MFQKQLRKQFAVTGAAEQLSTRTGSMRMPSAAGASSRHSEGLLAPWHRVPKGTRELSGLGQSWWDRGKWDPEELHGSQQPLSPALHKLRNDEEMALQESGERIAILTTAFLYPQ